MFAGFPVELAAVPDSQLFVVPIQQRGLVQVLTERDAEYGVDIRWGHAMTGFDQDGDGVTVHAAGPDGAYALADRYLVGTDGGHSKTRHLAGIEFRRTRWSSGSDSTCCPRTNGLNRSVTHPDPITFHRSERMCRYGRIG
jgi:2-polyprenyl-6-methoxyphenol hydroxylase-like FAD-dependent oxidoreductase